MDFNSLCNTILKESLLRDIASGYYLCNNAIHTGVVINALQRYTGILVQDGGLIELTGGADRQLVQLIASLFEYDYIRKYTSLQHKNPTVYKTSILSKQQLLHTIKLS